ncbi:alkaline phosphatase D family protein [Sorangium sp. So ce1099]|uniref:alkaline phosphatase D family protein n=1 Tax=Sorangium sp. So ce1099 TaxID=3133331 RepID=UPI003F606A0E
MREISTVFGLSLCLFPLLPTLACSDADGASATGTHGGGGGTGGSGGAGGSGPRALKTRIAFGSCMHQDKKKPVLELATASAPDLFVFLGDNIYGDSNDIAVLQAKYDKLAASPEFQGLLAAVPVIATWDDHDYGANDAGKEFPQKAATKDLFLDFWKEPAGSPRRTREGIYTSYLHEATGGTVQIILLDTRWFRDPLDANSDPAKYKHDYQPTTDKSRTMLGDAQWAWLEGELKKPADVRIIGTSTQFGHEYNGYESWTNMPHERQRMVDLIRDTGAEATLFISGDVHWGELSRLEAAGGYPLYDLTSSGITETWPEIEENANRVGSPVAENNYGFVEIAWGEVDHALSLGIVDVAGTTRVEHEVSTSELRF